MKRLLLFLPFFVAACDNVATDPAVRPSFSANIGANANGNKLQCFSGTTDALGFGGTCSLTESGVGTLDNTDGNTNGDYSGVYIQNSNLNGKSLAEVALLGFNYTGTALAGSPRISLPLDTDGDGVSDTYAFISAFHCNDGAGLVDAINDETCTIFVSPQISGYDNWAAFEAANPTYTIGPDGALPFIIADDVGSWTVSNVRLGKGPARAVR